ncbi:hypothetical protein HDV05_004760 [Chytridiales sp. JEL 0842]|nr:hypothetical protein HDV05_004760 [Chytridiales sp. JEL 0842]
METSVVVAIDPGDEEQAVCLDGRVEAFVAKYVWDTIFDDAKRERMLHVLDEGEAYVQDEEMAVVMIDISGYSQLTSELFVMGKLASEIITKLVNNYLNKLITIISKYQGDIVKFLGDALLVSFSSMGPQDDGPKIIKRAFNCCLEILCKEATLNIDLDDLYLERGGRSCTVGQRTYTEFKKNRLPSTTRSNVAETSAIEKTNPGSNAASGRTILTLGVHVALTFGLVSRQIFGRPQTRLDYNIHGECFGQLGAILDTVKVSELGFDAATWVKISRQIPTRFIPSNVDQKLLKFDRESLKRLYDALLNEAGSPKLLEPLKQTDSGESCTTLLRAQFQQLWQLASKFVNQSLVRKTWKKKTVDPSTDLDGDDFLEMPESSEESSHSEFRTVTIMFAKLPITANSKVTNQLCRRFMEEVVTWKGVFQQFQADDKGLGMIACFGLPPWTFDKAAIHALKCADSYTKSLMSLKLPEVMLGVATGPILYSTLGNRLRSEASLLGDAVNLAARLMSIAKPMQSIVCDVKTFESTKNDTRLVKMGDFKIKGKMEDVPLWYLDITSSDHKKRLQASSQGDFISVGYRAEKGKISDAFLSWRAFKAEHISDDHDSSSHLERLLIVVEGESGVGKSNLLEFILHTQASNAPLLTITQATEIEQQTPYHGLQPVMNTLLRHYLQEDATRVFLGASRSSELIPATPQTNQSNTSLLNSLNIVITKTSNLSIEKATTQSSSAALRDQSKQQQHTSSSSLAKNAKFLSSSNHRKRLSSHTGHYGIQSHLSIQTIQDFLVRLGESPNLAPLLAPLLPFVPLEDNDHTKSWDGAYKKAMLKSLLIRILTNAAGLWGPWIWVVDDAQWMDETSMEVFSGVLIACKFKMAVVLFARPIADSQSLLKAVKRLEHSLHIVLSGFSAEDTAELVLRKFSNIPIRYVDPTFASVLCDIAEGKPLVIDLLFASLIVDTKSATGGSSKTLTVSSDGGLYASDLESMKQYLSSMNQSGAAMTYFDRLDSDFQIFLKRATLFGMHFALEDIVGVFGDTLGPSSVFCGSPEPSSSCTSLNIDMENIKKWISEKDMFKFLVPLAGRHGSAEKECAKDTDSTAVNIHDDRDLTKFQFRHISILNALYDSQSYEERCKLHSKVGKYFEKQRTSYLDGKEGDEALLPILAHHYSRSADLGKKVRYMEALAYSYYRKSHFLEARSLLEVLVDMLDSGLAAKETVQKQSGDEQVNYAATTIFIDENWSTLNNPARKADWLAHIVNINTRLRTFKGTMDLCVQALKLCGYTLPKKRKDVLQAIAKAIWELILCSKETESATKARKGCEYMPPGVPGHNNPAPSKSSPAKSCVTGCPNCPKISRVKSLVFRAIIIEATAVISLDNLQIFLVLLQSLICDMSTGAVDNGEWFSTTARCALLLYNKLPVLSRRCARWNMEADKRFQKQDDGVGVVIGASLDFLMGAMVSALWQFFKGRSEPVIVRLRQILDAFNVRGDTGNFLATIANIASINFWLLNFAGIISDCEPYATFESTSISNVLPSILHYLASRSRIVLLDPDNDEILPHQVKDSMRNIREKMKKLSQLLPNAVQFQSHIHVLNAFAYFASSYFCTRKQSKEDGKHSAQLDFERAVGMYIDTAKFCSAYTTPGPVQIDIIVFGAMFGTMIVLSRVGQEWLTDQQQQKQVVKVEKGITAFLGSLTRQTPAVGTEKEDSRSQPSIKTLANALTAMKSVCVKYCKGQTIMTCALAFELYKAALLILESYEQQKSFKGCRRYAAAKMLVKSLNKGSGSNQVKWTEFPLLKGVACGVVSKCFKDGRVKSEYKQKALQLFEDKAPLMKNWVGEELRW